MRSNQNAQKRSAVDHRELKSCHRRTIEICGKQVAWRRSAIDKSETMQNRFTHLAGSFGASGASSHVHTAHVHLLQARGDREVSVAFVDRRLTTTWNRATMSDEGELMQYALMCVGGLWRWARRGLSEGQSGDVRCRKAREVLAGLAKFCQAGQRVSGGHGC